MTWFSQLSAYSSKPKSFFIDDHTIFNAFWKKDAWFSFPHSQNKKKHLHQFHRIEMLLGRYNIEKMRMKIREKKGRVKKHEQWKQFVEIFTYAPNTLLLSLLFQLLKLRVLYFSILVSNQKNLHTRYIKNKASPMSCLHIFNFKISNSYLCQAISTFA